MTKSKCQNLLTAIAYDGGEDECKLASLPPKRPTRDRAIRIRFRDHSQPMHDFLRLLPANGYFVPKILLRLCSICLHVVSANARTRTYDLTYERFIDSVIWQSSRKHDNILAKRSGPLGEIVSRLVVILDSFCHLGLVIWAFRDLGLPISARGSYFLFDIWDFLLNNFPFPANEERLGFLEFHFPCFSTIRDGHPVISSEFLLRDRLRRCGHG